MEILQCVGSVLGHGPRPPHRGSMLSLDPPDQALQRLHRTDLEYASRRVDGLASHGPMVVASLDEIGRQDRIEAFLADYVPRLRALPPLDRATPRLGDPTTGRAWIAHYEARLLGAPDWRPIATQALVDLLPGAVAGAAHGWLRAAHALHMLSAHDTETRRRELAHGLASWAARFERLPGRPGARATAGLDVAEALARVPLVPASRRGDGLLLSDRTRVVGELDGFGEAVEAVDLEAIPVGAAISRLAMAVARIFLKAPEDAQFAYLHAMTATSALRFVDDLLDAQAQRAALGAVFQVVAALHATNGDGHSKAVARTGQAVTRDRILGRLGETLEDHDIKLAVAALREDARTPQPEMLEAAGIYMGIEGPAAPG
jgi:hypothetical protein